MSIGSNWYFSFPYKVSSPSASCQGDTEAIPSTRSATYLKYFIQVMRRSCWKYLVCSALLMHRAECHSGQVLRAVLPCLCAASILRFLLEFRRSTKNVRYGFSHFPFLFIGSPASQEFFYITEEGLVNAAVLAVLQH